MFLVDFYNAATPKGRVHMIPANNGPFLQQTHGKQVLWTILFAHFPRQWNPLCIFRKKIADIPKVSVFTQFGFTNPNQRLLEHAPNRQFWVFAAAYPQFHSKKGNFPTMPKDHIVGLINDPHIWVIATISLPYPHNIPTISPRSPMSPSCPHIFPRFIRTR